MTTQPKQSKQPKHPSPLADQHIYPYMPQYKVLMRLDANTNDYELYKVLSIKDTDFLASYRYILLHATNQTTLWQDVDSGDLWVLVCPHNLGSASHLNGLYQTAQYDVTFQLSHGFAWDAEAIKHAKLTRDHVVHEASKLGAAIKALASHFKMTRERVAASLTVREEVEAFGIYNFDYHDEHLYIEVRTRAKKPHYTQPTQPADPAEAHFDSSDLAKLGVVAVVGPNRTQIMGMSHTSVDAYAGYNIGNGKGQYEYAIIPNPLLGPDANPITPTEWEQLVTACKALNYDWGKIARAWFQLGRYLHNLSKRTHQTWLIDNIYHTEGTMIHGRSYGLGWLRARIIAPPNMNDPLDLTDDSGALLPNDSSLTYLQPSEPEHKVIWWRHNKGNGHWEVG